MRLTQSVITECLLKHLVSFCSTFAKFEAKFDANALLLHVHHFNEKICKTTQTQCCINAYSKQCLQSAQNHPAH